MFEKPIPVVVTVEVLEQLINSDGFTDDVQVDMVDLVRLAAHYYRDNDRPEDARAVLESWDLCPVHERDIEICADDDDPECREYRKAGG